MWIVLFCLFCFQNLKTTHQVGEDNYDTVEYQETHLQGAGGVYDVQPNVSYGQIKYNYD